MVNQYETKMEATLSLGSHMVRLLLWRTTLDQQ